GEHGISSAFRAFGRIRRSSATRPPIFSAASAVAPEAAIALSPCPFRTPTYYLDHNSGYVKARLISRKTAVFCQIDQRIKQIIFSCSIISYSSVLLLGNRPALGKQGGSNEKFVIGRRFGTFPCWRNLRDQGGRAAVRPRCYRHRDQDRTDGSLQRAGVRLWQLWPGHDR